MYSYATSRFESAICSDPPAVESRLGCEINLWYYIIAECKLEAEKKEMKKKAEEYLARAERLKERVKDLEGT